MSQHVCIPLARNEVSHVANRKRFYQLCSGPLKGRTISPGTPDYLVVTRGGWGTRTRFGMSAASGDQPGPNDRGAGPRDLVHVYEAFDLVDEISMEIVLCKFIGTQPVSYTHLTLPTILRV